MAMHIQMIPWGHLINIHNAFSAICNIEVDLKEKRGYFAYCVVLFFSHVKTVGHTMCAPVQKSGILMFPDYCIRDTQIETEENLLGFGC